MIGRFAYSTIDFTDNTSYGGVYGCAYETLNVGSYDRSSMHYKILFREPLSCIN